MSWLELLLIPLGAAVGMYGTLVGTGGGFVLMPALLIIYADEDPASITSISLAVVFFNALSGSAAYARLRRIDYRSGLAFAAASVPGAVGGAYAVHSVPRHVFEAAFGIALVAVALWLMISAGRSAVVRQPLRGRFIVRRTIPGAEEGQEYRYSYNILHGLAAAAVIGFLSSLLGIGGGVFHVPVMIDLLRFPVHVATATSQLVLMFMAGEASAIHIANGDMHGANLLRALLLAAGAAPGAQLGARVSHRFHGSTISRLLAAALLCIGGRLLYVGIA